MENDKGNPRARDDRDNRRARQDGSAHSKFVNDVTIMRFEPLCYNYEL